MLPSIFPRFDIYLSFEDNFFMKCGVFYQVWFLILQVYPQGKMSQHFASLKPGDVVEVKGYFYLFCLPRYLQILYCMSDMSLSSLNCCAAPLKSSDTLQI